MRRSATTPGGLWVRPYDMFFGCRRDRRRGQPASPACRIEVRTDPRTSPHAPAAPDQEAPPRLLIGAATGALLAAAWPMELARQHPHAAHGWSAGVWTYLVLIGWMMFRTDADGVEELQEPAPSRSARRRLILAILGGAASAGGDRAGAGPGEGSPASCRPGRICFGGVGDA
ncbi:hypothetical protein ACU4GR_04730, partial [Methylobacterium oryzae CBMB20]